MRFREEKRLRRKDALKAGVAAAVALALLAGGAAALHFWENDRYATGSDEVGSAVIAARPASRMTMEMTVAKIGRSIKKREITGPAPYGCLAAAGSITLTG